MKTELTIEQSQRLIELGINANKASGESLVGGSIFTLADLLGLLPKWIKYRYKLMWPQIWIDSYSETWCAAYKDVQDMDIADTFQSSEELVDCLALLLEFLIKEKLITI